MFSLLWFPDPPSPYVVLSYTLYTKGDPGLRLMTLVSLARNERSHVACLVPSPIVFALVWALVPWLREIIRVGMHWRMQVTGVVREQAACILATEERMRHQKLLSVSKVTIVVEVWSEGAVVHSGLVPWVWHRLSCHISITFSSSFLVSFFAFCFWLLHSSHHTCLSMSVRFTCYVARFTVSIRTSGSVHYIPCARFTVSLQIDTTQVLAQLSQWLLPQLFIQTRTSILQCSRPWCSAIIGPAVAKSAVLHHCPVCCYSHAWHWHGKWVSLTTGLLITGLLITGLDWTGILKFVLRTVVCNLPGCH